MFYITRIDTQDPQTILESEKVSCDQEPINGALLIIEPGFYQLTWDNSFSWFTSKQLRFRVTVLEPLKFKFAIDEFGNFPVVQIVNDIEIDPFIDCVTIGIFIQRNWV